MPPAVIASPAEAIFAEGSFWVLNLEPLEFVQIDPTDGAVLRRIASPIDDVGYYTVDGNDLWVTHWTQPVMSRVDIERGREVTRFEGLPGDGGSGGVLVADGSLWVARRDADDYLGMLARLDPVTGEVQHLFRSLPGSLALAYGDDGAVWTAGSFGDVNRVESRTNTVTSTNVGGRNFYVAAGGGYGWTADEARGVVYQIDSAGKIAGTFPTGAGARVVSFSGGILWVGNSDEGTASAIDLATGSETTYEFGHPIQAVAAGVGRVLVQILPGQTFDEIVAEFDGHSVRLFTDGYDLDPPDPALTRSSFGFQIADATCAGLLRRTSDGEQVEPEVAADLPDLSDDGRTYTFTIRGSYEFSPPDGGAVTAETFRASIERALSPKLGPDAPGPAVLGDIDGLGEFQAGNTDHIAGLATAGDTLSITLAAPSDDFLERLASPYFCAVPIETPILAGTGGAAIPILGGAPGEVVVPSAGPYYIARHVHGDYTILRRNPNYEGPRPHRFEAIAVRGGVDPQQAVELVAAGEWDGIVHLSDERGPVAEIFADRIGCIRHLPDNVGVDLTSLCLATSVDE